MEFWKMNGSGNDFILIDNREGQVAEKDMSRLVRSVCRRRESVGADGMIFVERSVQHDFSWRFFNADGGEAEMCGNGGRCVARFAYLRGISGPELSFDTLAGTISAHVSGRIVKVMMPRPSGHRQDIDLPLRSGWLSVDFINTGVPHVVVQVEALSSHPVVEHGRTIRYDSHFEPAGTNANFMAVIRQDLIEVRTYERGVEDETLACGTGAIASALTASARALVKSPVMVKTKGGEILRVHYEDEGDGVMNVWLEGGTSIVYRAHLDEEALSVSAFPDKPNP
jgi:diaminopimelate epimerase